MINQNKILINNSNLNLIIPVLTIIYNNDYQNNDYTICFRKIIKSTIKIIYNIYNIYDNFLKNLNNLMN